MNWRAVVEKLAGGSDSTRRTAAAFALGVFLSFSPFMGLQIAVGMTTAFLLKLNRAGGLHRAVREPALDHRAVVHADDDRWRDDPGSADRPDFGRRFDALMELSFYTAEFRSQAFDLVAPFFWSFVIGSTAGAALVGVAAYFVIVPLLARWRAARDAQQRTADGHVDAP